MVLRTHHKLILSYSLLIAAVVVILVVGVEPTLRPPLLSRAAEDLAREVVLAAELYDSTPGAEPDALARQLEQLTGRRVSIIASDGTVVGDSGVHPDSVAALDDHSGRPEVRGADRFTPATAVRRSESIDADLLYAAVVTRTGDVMRFSVGVEQIDDAVRAVRRQILQVGAFALVVVAMLSVLLSLAATRPVRQMQRIATAMAGGDLSVRVRSERRDEIGELGAALDSLARELQRRISQLEGERAEMRALFDAMAEGVLALGPDGSVRRANRAAHTMFDLPSDFGGIRPEMIARRRDFLSLVERALGGEPIPPTELSYRRMLLLLTAQPLPAGGAVLVFLDVTELRRLEDVRRDFVANASHELKTPLTAIRGYSETLLADDLPPELRAGFIERLHDNAGRLQNILDDLLDLSRIESGGLKLDVRPVDLTAAAQDAWRPIEGAASQKEIEFRMAVEDGFKVVPADPGALRQILANLFSNAVRYTPNGGSVELLGRCTADRAVIEVRDTGSGIPSSKLERIFERFYRVDPARSRVEGGTGLGLAIVKHLVERHGGHVEAESRLGEGTTIRFDLPLRKGHAPSHDD